MIDVFLREIASRDYGMVQIDARAHADRDVCARRRLDRPTGVALIDGAVAGFADLQNNRPIDSARLTDFTMQKRPGPV